MPIPEKTERNTRIINDRFNGIPEKEIAYNYNLSAGRVRDICQKYGFNYSSFLKQRNIAIFHDSLSGMKPADIARKYGLHITYVYQILKG